MNQMNNNIQAQILERLDAVDWSFSETKSLSPFSWLHWHPCRYVSQVPATLIGLLSRPDDLVIDPFSGSGTTGVEAQRLGRRFAGSDINPVAVLMAQAKLLNASAVAISKEIAKLRNGAPGAIARPLPRGRSAPEAVQLEKWYSQEVGRDLTALWCWLQDMPEGDAQTVGAAAFSSILLQVCRETRHWGYVCDNTNPKGDGGGKNVLKEFDRALVSFHEAYQRRDEAKSRSGGSAFPAAPVLHQDAAEFCRSLGQEVQLVVTSPPYFGVADYVKSQRLTMEWLGYDIEPLRQSEIGARSKRHRKTARPDYLNELRSVFEAARSVLSPRGYCAVVLGESKRRKAILDDFEGMMLQIGFQSLRQYDRAISIGRRMNPSIMQERIVVFQRRE